MDIVIPKLSLVVLIGPSGCGKSSFAKKHFLETEVLTSDYCRALISDDENEQSVTKDAFEVLHFIARKRLAAGRLTVIDATNVQKEARKPLVALAREFHCLPVAIVFDLPEKVCHERNKNREDRNFGPHVIRQQKSQLRRSIKGLKYEGFRHIYKLKTDDEVNSAVIRREPLWNDKTELSGPFDIIGDVHGCYDELVELLDQLGYAKTENTSSDNLLASDYFSHLDGRTAVFLGDFVDRGPKVVDCIKLIYSMVRNGSALCVPGNHEMKLMRKLRGKDVQITHGLGESLEQIDKAVREAGDDTNVMGEIVSFLDGLVSHYVLDKGRLVVAHAGLPENMQGRGSGKVREFCLYGETTGETDEFGLPIRYNWAAEYRGGSTVVYGHTPVPEPEWLNNTVNIDTGCVFGGALTALRYPEREFVSVQAHGMYNEPVRPLKKAGHAEGMTAQQTYDDLLDADDVLGKRIVTTRLRSSVTIREENAMAALEVMSRFAVDPKWLIYLPPTMSPSETSSADGYLEYPEEAFTYFRANGIPKVICEEKHMGSRAIVIVCKDAEAAIKRFGVPGDNIGVVYTRTGRRFFNDEELERTFLEHIRQALVKADFWEEYETNWVCLDCELMPWSAKAQELLKSQYAAVGAAATNALAKALDDIHKTANRKDLEKSYAQPQGSGMEEFDIDALENKFEVRKDMLHDYISAYERYCWPVNTIDDLKLAPFHIMAIEGKVLVEKDHEWHMDVISKICRADSNILLETATRVIDVTDESDIASGSKWWESLTEKGSEGMVVKPMGFVAKGKRGLVQPALKCRGREYLRIIYGAEYTLESNLDRLRSRSLHTKRSLALREFALGIEALERFVRKEPLRRVHECVFGVLALESEPVDPRL